MTITEKMYSVMAAMGSLTALVPADRILPPGPWQNIPRPYIVHFPVSQVPILTHERHADLQFWEFYQLSIFTDTFAQGDAIADLLSRSLPGNHDGVEVFLRGGSAYFQDSRPVDERFTTQVLHFVLEFKIAEAL